MTRANTTQQTAGSRVDAGPAGYADSLRAAENVYGIKSRIGDRQFFVALKTLDDLKVPGRDAAVIAHAAKALGTSIAGLTIVICQTHFELELYKTHPQILETAVSALQAARQGKVVRPMVVESSQACAYQMVELHPDKNAILIRRADPVSEIGVPIGKRRADGSLADSLGIFPRYSRGQNKQVFAFMPADTLPRNLPD